MAGDFDPDKYLKEKTGGGFDPDAYLKAKTGAAPQSAPPAKPEPPSLLNALGKGVVQGGSFGWGDELGAAEQATLLKLFSKDPSSWTDLYRSARNENRQENQAAQDAHPWAYAGGNLAGSLATAALPVPGALGANGLKGMSAAQKLWALTKAGVPLGALAGLGMSNADLTRGDVGGAALDSAFAAGTSVALPFGVSAVASRLAPALRSAAANRAVEALGTKLGQYRKLDYQDAIQPLGAELMEKGQIPFFGGAKTIQQRVGGELDTQGKSIGDLLKALDEKAGDAMSTQQRALLPAGPAQAQPGLIPVSQLHLERVPQEQWSMAGEAALPEATRNARPVPGAAPSPGGSPADLFVRPSAVRTQATNEVVAPLKKLPGIAVGNVPQRLSEEIGSLASPGDRMTLQQANDILRAMDARNGDVYTKEGSQLAEGLKQVRGILRGAQQDAAVRIDPELAAKLQAAKGSYGNMAKAKAIIDDTVLRNDSNHDLSLYDMMALLAGGGSHAVAHGGPDAASILTGLGAAGATHLIRKSGNAMAANAAWQGANALQSPLLLRALQARQPRSLGDLLGLYDNQR